VVVLLLSWMLPRFADEAARRDAWLTKRVKSNDFNDLHAAEGLHVVRAQVESRLSDLGWNPSARKPAGAAPRGEGNTPAELRPIETIDELLGLQLMANTPDISDEHKRLIIERQRARDNKDWTRSDELREELSKAGVSVNDTPSGTIWSYI
jgi:cysteinyl-tRNA synthetase